MESYVVINCKRRVFKLQGRQTEMAQYGGTAHQFVSSGFLLNVAIVLLELSKPVVQDVKIRRLLDVSQTAWFILMSRDSSNVLRC